nr:hypothetical protein [Moorella sp. E306M]
MAGCTWRVMDLYSRRITGYSMRKNLNRELVIEALNNAVSNRGPSQENLSSTPTAAANTQATIISGCCSNMALSAL